MTYEIFLPQHVCVCAPAVRMLALFAKHDDDDTVAHDVLPVVALRSTLGALYATVEDVAKPPAVGASAAEMRENGWRFVATEAREEPLVLDEQSRILTVRDRSVGWPEVVQVIAAPWPPEEDDRRLRKTLAALKARARRRDEDDEDEGDDYEVACGAPEQRHLAGIM